MPTALERAGDFSQTRTGGIHRRSGAVKGPLTGIAFGQCHFPTRIDPLGAALMNISASQYHGYGGLLHQPGPSIDHPRREVMRYDLRRRQDTIGIKYQNWFTRAWLGSRGRSSPWGLVRQRYDFTADQGG